MKVVNPAFWDIGVMLVINVGVADEEIVLKVWGTHHCLTNLAIVLACLITFRYTLLPGWYKACL